MPDTTWEWVPVSLRCYQKLVLCQLIKCLENTERERKREREKNYIKLDIGYL